MKKIKVLFFLVAVCFGLMATSCEKTHTHEYGDWQVSIPATCTTDGEDYRKW